MAAVPSWLPCSAKAQHAYKKLLRRTLLRSPGCPSFLQDQFQSARRCQSWESRGATKVAHQILAEALSGT